jgi:metal-sulfur cluster biosynthetic enzyme
LTPDTIASRQRFVKVTAEPSQSDRLRKPGPVMGSGGSAMSTDALLNEDIARVRQALDAIRDPCHALSGHDLSILDLGLVNEVSRRGDVIRVSITFTEPTCVFSDRIVGALQDLAGRLPDVAEVVVEIEPLPIWEPSRLSARARHLFAARRSAFASSFHDVPISIQQTARSADEPLN